MDGRIVVAQKSDGAKVLDCNVVHMVLQHLLWSQPVLHDRELMVWNPAIGFTISIDGQVLYDSEAARAALEGDDGEQEGSKEAACGEAGEAADGD
jgi:hypothetical protein